MRLNEKIRHIRKNVLGITLKDFHKKLKNIFGKEALTYYSLCRIEKGYRESARLNSLYQICTGLGISLKELKDGTDEEESKIVNIIARKNRSENKYSYNKKAVAEVLSSRELRFLAMELTILPEGKTTEEEDPVDVNKYEKLIVMLQGTIHVYIGEEKHTIKKGDTLSFASNIPHHFANPSKDIKARFIVIQNPKSY